MIFTKLYSTNGKEIFPRKGMIVQPGTIVLNEKRNFVTVDEPMVIDKTKEQNDMGYSIIGDWFLIKK